MKKLKSVLLIAVLVGLSGCATTNKDPLEGVNRGIYKFNDVVDQYAMKPVAKAYKAVTPTPVRTGISNFFNNLGTLTTVVNDLLQLKFAQAFTDAGRFVINTTFGIAGFIDVASKDNIPKHQEDFGQTLGHWGVGSGPYLVLPILGPSTVRDAGGLAFDTVTSDPITYLHNTGQIRAHNQVRIVQFVDKRTQLLDAKDLVDDASIDPYAFMRDAYLQRRASLVQDGIVPQELLQDEFEPEDEEPAKPAKATAVEHPVAADTVVLQSDVPIEENVSAMTSQIQQPEVQQSEIQQPAVEDIAVTSEQSVSDQAVSDQTLPDVAADSTDTPAATQSQEVLPPLVDQVSQQAVEESVATDDHAANVVAGIDETLLTLEAPAK
ncbi:MAG: MlaA family lipoprotein [Methylophilus sp.]|uniref:MlaA family lipoprotein n=1 Tax=Methylophilus sp. TaxID=29541 RepID=UPI003F9FBB39